jgi:glyoxalase family protein
MIRSLHHLTATVDGAQEDLDCYVGVLGMRLVKKTVNFDNRDVYHFYYGDEAGTPSTLMTTFPYRRKGVDRGTHGAGQITATALSVPAGSLAGWRERLSEAGYAPRDEDERFGDEVLAFDDPSGLVIELIANDDDDRTPWVDGGVAADSAVRGLYGASLAIRDPRASIRFLVDGLGWDVVVEEGGRTRLAVGGDHPGHRLDIVHTPAGPDAVNGLGTVHHVAMAVDDPEAQLQMRDRIVALGVRVTHVLDRQYFRSIYFREPGGILYEIATLGPGFQVDEELAALGRDLQLPPWEEKHRAAIERGLSPVTY